MIYKVGGTRPTGPVVAPMVCRFLQLSVLLYNFACMAAFCSVYVREIVFFAYKTSLRSVFYGGCKRDTARICC